MKCASIPKMVRSFLASPSSCFSYVAQRHDIAHKMKELRKRLDSISNERNSYGFKLMRETEELEWRTTTSVIDVSRVCGRDKDKETLVNMLRSESSQGSILRIISVVGMGGIGKTTIAQLVYNDSKVTAHFDKKIWVCVSDPFDVIKISKAILESLKGDKPNLEELESLLEDIRRCVAEKKFLLVLDDVWTEDDRIWEPLKLSLQCGAPGSRILVTTRKEKVAKVMGSKDGDKFSLGTLSEGECWSLFSQIAFLERTDEEREYLEDIARQIASKCKGLPLAAKILGSLMRFKQTREQWENILESEIWELEEAEKGIFPPLLLSYYDLPVPIRQCFLYCAIFPKDYIINITELITLWMAQGYLSLTRSTEIEIVGLEYFQNLAMRSFFQDFDEDMHGRIIECKMHDIVHDVAQLLTKNECLTMEVNGVTEKRMDFSQRRPRHLLMLFENQSNFPDSVYEVEHLRTLSIEPPPTKGDWPVPDKFHRFKYLRALNLSWSSAEKIPSQLGDQLIHLRSLKISGIQGLKELPEVVCDLCNLQILDLNNCKDLEILPQGIVKLINLRLLTFDWTSVRFLPKGIGRLNSLRTLSPFVLSDGHDSQACKLGDLRYLTNLRGHLHIKGLGKVTDVDEAKKADLNLKDYIRKLHLEFGSGDGSKDNDCLEALKAPSATESLKISGHRGPAIIFPDWILSLRKLRKLTLQDCHTPEHLPPLWKLPYLEFLVIDSMSSLFEVGLEFLGMETYNDMNDIAFPKLKELKFRAMVEWKEWNGKTEEAIVIMPSLRFLRIHSCPNLVVLPDFFHLIQLEKLEILFCDKLSELCRRGSGQEWPKICHIPNITTDINVIGKDRSALPWLVNADAYFQPPQQ